MAVEIANKRSKKQVIFDQAAILFRDKGYQATSMRDLAEKVGLEPSSLYSHIKSKEELLIKICFQCANDFMTGLENINNEVSDAPFKIRSLIRLHVSIALDDHASITVFNDEWKNLTEPYFSKFVGMRKSYEKNCLDIINDGIKNGTIANHDPQILLDTILFSTRWVHHKNLDHSEQRVETFTNTISDIILKGISK